MAKKKAGNKGGRPPAGDKPFDDKFIFECMKKQKAAWKKSAKAIGVSLGEWVRRALDRAASSP